MHTHTHTHKNVTAYQQSTKLVCLLHVLSETAQSVRSSAAEDAVCKSEKVDQEKKNSEEIKNTNTPEMDEC